MIGVCYSREGKGKIGEQRECEDMRVAQVRSSGYKGRRKVSVQYLGEIATQDKHNSGGRRNTGEEAVAREVVAVAAEGATVELEQ